MKDGGETGCFPMDTMLAGFGLLLEDILAEGLVIYKAGGLPLLGAGKAMGCIGGCPSLDEKAPGVTGNLVSKQGSVKRDVLEVCREG